MLINMPSKIQNCHNQSETIKDAQLYGMIKASLIDAPEE
jgi:hypothetical protein